MVKENAMKQTEIGLIPEDWQVVNIQSLIDDNFILHHIDGNHGALYPKSSEFKRAGIPYVGANSLINGKIDYKNVKYLSEERCLAFQKGVAKPHDLLFAHNATVGPVGLVDSKYEKVILSTTLTYFRCNSEFLCGKFLLYEFQSNRFIRQYSAVMSQSTRNQVPISAQRKFQIPLPPLAEQEAIAAALSDCDAWIESLEAVIAKKRLIKQGAMQELLIPKEDWEVRKFDEVFKRIPSKSFQINSIEYSNSGQFPIIDQGQQEIVGYSDRVDKVLKVNKNGVIIFGDHTRIIKFSTVNFIVGADGVQLLTSTECNNKFLYFTLLKIDIPNTGYNRHFKYLFDFPYHIPSLSEQTRIATVLSDMDAELEALGQKLNKARQIKQAMMQ